MNGPGHPDRKDGREPGAGDNEEIVGHYLAMPAVLGQSEGHPQLWLRRVYNPTCQIHVELVKFCGFRGATRARRNRPQKSIGDSNATGVRKPVFARRQAYRVY
jgi:hypothetical protein